MPAGQLKLTKRLDENVASLFQYGGYLLQHVRAANLVDSSRLNQQKLPGKRIFVPCRHASVGVTIFYMEVRLKFEKKSIHSYRIKMSIRRKREE
jgi:hypothetical protein